MTTVQTVWITRAKPGAHHSADRLSGLGFTPVVAPLLEVRPLDVRPDLTGIQALAFTSRNGVRAFADRSADRALPVFAVGDATAAAAREAGFTDVRSADGDLPALAALIRAEGVGRAILHPAAAEPAGDLAALVGDAARITTVAVYEAVETDTSAPDAWDAVLIYSPRAARALAARLAPGAVGDRIAIAISLAAAEPLTALGFAEIRIAEAPTEDRLLAALGKPRVNV
ncbi:uroporphyrinogen-III synthase [Brevundimonas staleyi]|uniref:Uroporphyrinogen-III synthase n=1 Tax=Brevundimonas staleyi TaxID=74326 RepID=A0ABW0FTQ1_9CAUL